MVGGKGAVDVLAAKVGHFDKAVLYRVVDARIVSLQQASGWGCYYTLVAAF